MSKLLFDKDRRANVFTKAVLSVVSLALGALPIAPAFAQSRTIVNGSANGLPPNFLFEPEVPFASLKSAPIWNELEQLLDDPYRVALCSSLTDQQLNADNGAAPLTAQQLALIKNTPANEQGFASYCSKIKRRSGFGVALPPLIVHPLNYNPSTGEEMRLLNPFFPATQFDIPDELVQCLGDVTNIPNIGCTPGVDEPNRWAWLFKRVTVSAGAERIPHAATAEAQIDNNGPIAPDLLTCILTTETVPPEGDILCGRDPGEPGLPSGPLGLYAFGVKSAQAYSNPAVPTPAIAGRTPAQVTAALKADVTGFKLYAPGRGPDEASPAPAYEILARDANGRYGLRKPSLRVKTAGGTPTNPNYLVNRTDAGGISRDPSALTPSNENDYVMNRDEAITLGKALFWDMQVGSDGVQSCGTCHFTGAGTDTRTKNQLNPNHLGGHTKLVLGDTADPNNSGGQAGNYDLKLSDFPLHKLTDFDVAGDPLCTPAIFANVNAGVLDNNPLGIVNQKVCDANNHVGPDVTDVVSSMGVKFSLFGDIASIGSFQNAVMNVAAVMPDVRPPANLNQEDPLLVFRGLRRVEPRNTPTMQAAGFNFDNFWDGRARHDFNGGSVFGAADPQSHVFVDANGRLVPTRQLIRFSSIASLATGPGLSEFEMSFQGRNWSKIGKKLLQAKVTPLANQLVSTTDSVLGRYSNQGGSSCTAAAIQPQDRSGSWTSNNTLPDLAPGKPGLCISYQGLIRRAFYPALHANTTWHLDGCYTDGNAALHPNQCAANTVKIPALVNGDVVDSAADPFDNYVLKQAQGAAIASNTNSFTQMEGNFSLFWGLGVSLWVGILIPDNTPFDQFLEANPDAFETLGEPGELGLVADHLNCTSDTQRYCFREFGNFKRDNAGLRALQTPTGEGGAGGVYVTGALANGTRDPNDPNAPDPLLGLDLFFASNLSLKNPNFRTARCGECHAVPTLTDHTVAFTVKAQLRDFIKEFVTGQPGVETAVEPLGRLRVISGFLLEQELAENGQDGVERRIINQSIVPNPSDGLAYPDGLLNPSGNDIPGLYVAPVDRRYTGAGQAFFDNGVYNIGVRPIDNDIGRGGTDAFGWPLSLAALMLKNMGGTNQEPGTELPVFDVDDPSGGGGLFEETAQDQQVNPGVSGEPVDPQLPPYLAPFANQINVGDAAPDMDELNGGLNTLTNVPTLEGFIDTLGPFNPAGILNESLNMSEGPMEGTWPVVNRVGRNGSFKAPQLRNVELTGPYFHNGGKATLRQVIDFYSRGGDFPVTNAAHRDFNIMNLSIEVQSNLTEAEKVALVDFLLELTDERVAYNKAPFDHPEVIIPIDGAAPDNTGRPNLLANTAQFRSVPAVGAAGYGTREPTFMNISKQRLVGAAANCDFTTHTPATPTASQYCH